MIADKFQLDDASFWTDPWANRKALQRPLMQNGEESFLIGAPRLVALDRHQTLPLAILRVRKAQGGSPVDFRAMAVVAVWDFHRGRLAARLAFPKPVPAAASPKPSAAGAAAKGDSFSGDATAMISEASTLDLAERLHLPLAAAEYAVSLVCLDQAANGCRMEVIESSAYRDAAAEEFLRSYRDAELGPPRVHPEPGRGSADYTQQPRSPEIPREPGIALEVQRVTVMRADRPCPLHGSFRLPARAWIKKKDDGSNPGRPDPESPTAIVPIGLLLTGSVQPSPVVVNLNVPSYAPLETIGGETYAVGYFTLDLCAFADLAGTVQTYFLYALSGEAMSGPALAAFVNPVLTWRSPEEFARQA